MTVAWTDNEIRAAVEAARQALSQHGTKTAASKALGWSKAKLHEVLSGQRGGSRRPQPAPAEAAPETKPAKEKKKPIRLSKVDHVHLDLARGKVHRVILTSAQDDTPVFTPFWNNLLALANAVGASVAVGGYTYQLGVWSDHAVATAVYASELRDYMRFGRVNLTPEVMFVADANVLPTTASPLNGWHTVNKGNHVFVPHARRASDVIPRMPGMPPRYIQSTGTVTTPSYTPRAAGRKAIFHHHYGAVLLEIDVDGEIFPHEISAEPDGSFQVLGTRVDDGVVTDGYGIAALDCGDTHFEAMSPAIAIATWGVDPATFRKVNDRSLMDLLEPEHQIQHDVLDFRRRNHHDRHSIIKLARTLRDRADNVEDEVLRAARWLVASSRPGCVTHQIESNHDAALVKWLEDREVFDDLENSYYWHRLRGDWLAAVRTGDEGFNPIRHAMSAEPGYAEAVDFVSYGRGLVIAGIQCGLHGDIGMNGSKGSPNQFRRLGERVVTAHTHSPKIIEGVYVAGVSASLSQGYNDNGPGAWAHGHVVIYPSGQRGLMLLTPDGRAWAAGDTEDCALAMAA